MFDKLRSQRVSDEIAARIRDEIAAGRLSVGSRLPSERALADQLGVSRPALREAMRTLENAGILRFEKGVNGGAFVQNRSSDAIVTSMLDMYYLGGIEPRHLTQARIGCEGVVIRIACENATAEDIAELNANIEASEAAGASGDTSARIRHQLEFHRILARITGNPILQVIMEGMLEVLLRFLRSLGPYDSSYVTPSRRRFMKKFAARDADGAVAEMESLLKKLETSYLSRAELIENPVWPPRKRTSPGPRKRSASTARDSDAAQ
ncbi:MAG: FadR family transcriptional regulator [Burkholderiales bacterium]|nr:FadR family transcriptional regulator [Burkholderiales bacterium]